MVVLTKKLLLAGTCLHACLEACMLPCLLVASVFLLLDWLIGPQLAWCCSICGVDAMLNHVRSASQALSM